MRQKVEVCGLQTTWALEPAISADHVTPVDPKWRGIVGANKTVISSRIFFVLVSALLASLGPLLFTTSPALAAAPEAPEIQLPTEITAEFARLHGVLNPGKAGELGETYQFLYNVGSKCEGGSRTPEPPESSPIGVHKEVSANALPLEPNTQYTVCLVATNAALESTVGSSVTFKTLRRPEVPNTEPATEETATTATLNGVLNPQAENEPGTYRFIYKTGTECNSGGEQETPAEPSPGHKQEAVTASLTSLAPATQYTFCLIAMNSAGERAEGPPQTFTTSTAAPTLSEESFSALGVNTVTLTAMIDPNGLSTGYHVEYVNDAQFVAHGFEGATRLPASDALLPAADSAISLREELGELEAATVYHFRFVASNSLGAVPGVNATFKTATANTSSSTLPDGRAYELVSSASFQGEVYDPLGPLPPSGAAGAASTELPFRAAADGSAVAYVGDPEPIGGNGASGNGFGNEYIASRGAKSGSEGWESSDIEPPAAQGELGREAQLTEYESFSEDLSVGFLRSPSQLLAVNSDPAGALECTVMYTRTSEGFHALFGSTEMPADCGTPDGSNGQGEHVLFAGESGDGAQMLFQTPAALTKGATSTVGNGNDLYDSAGGIPRLVNVLPDGEVDANATFGGPATRADFSGVISADGSRVFWSDVVTGKVYVRENPLGPQGECTVTEDTCTVAVSAGPAKFWTASEDGRYAFYTEGEKLWRFDVQRGTREELAGMGADVQGVVGASKDGSVLYFVAGGALHSEKNSWGEIATKRVCEEGGSGGPGSPAYEEEHGSLAPGIGCNLYLWRVGQPLQFIAPLAAKDDNLRQLGANDYQAGDWVPGLATRTAEVTSDGSHLVFESTQHLTGYDDSVLGEGGLEVFVYSAGSGRLWCASCDPTGAPPDATIEEGNGATGATSHLPVSASNTFMRRWINEEGTEVFFDSSQPLVSQDTNRRQDVYEWEAEGTESCPTQTPARLDGGCVFLLSGGESKDLSYFADASASGSDVFLTHRGPLGQTGPLDDKVHLYDVRVGGGFPQTSLACTGTGCQGVPPAPPLFATPSSSTFSGVGNFAPSGPAKKVTKKAVKCAKDKKLSRGKCVKVKGKKKKTKAKKAKKTSTDRRAK
jgi:hypothetical protein